VRFLEVPEDFQNHHHLPHRGTYTYDGAGRLNQVVDAATNTTETYVWNADGTLASFSGPGYTRLLEYDEEGRLLRIRCHSQLSVCLGWAYRDFLQCQIDCYNTYLY